MAQVEVFRTTVDTPAQAAQLTTQLRRLFPACRITFDLADCDKVLRIAGDRVCPHAACRCLLQAGFGCVSLD